MFKIPEITSVFIFLKQRFLWYLVFVVFIQANLESWSNGKFCVGQNFEVFFIHLISCHRSNYGPMITVQTLISHIFKFIEMKTRRITRYVEIGALHEAVSSMNLSQEPPDLLSRTFTQCLSQAIYQILK